MKKFILSLCITAAIGCGPSAHSFTLVKNFNKGVAGNVAQGPIDSFTDAAGNSYYSFANVAEGPLSAELNITKGDTAFGTWGGIISFPSNLGKGSEVWVRVKTFMPIGFNYDSTSAGNRLKFLRLHTKSPTVTNIGYDDWYINPSGSKTPFSFIYEGENIWTDFGDNSTAINLGVWETYEMYLYLDSVTVSAGGNARVRLWKNGVLLKDITDRKTLQNDTAFVDGFFLFTYWNGGAPQTQKMWVDDIIVTSDQPTSKDSQGNVYVGTKDSTNFLPPPSSPTSFK